MDFDPRQSYISDAEGNIWQVLDADGNYDDAATAAAYQGGAGAPTHPAPKPKK